MAHKNKQNRSPWKERQRSDPQASKKNLSGKHRRPTESFSFAEADDRIYDIFRHHGFADYPHEKRQKLTRFYFLLQENQKTQNFTRLINLREIAIKHFIDSLIVAKLSKLSYPLMDMGTGAGFPGIPLKIDSPENRILLAEGVQSRVTYLKSVREQLALSDLDIIGKFIDESFVYPVQGVITRAVEDITNTLSKCVNCLPVGGKVFLMKGPNVDPEVKAAKIQLGSYFQLDQDIAYELPETPHKRRLLVFEKIKNKGSSI